ncbi:ATP-binding protein [Patulibacter minatonensis]|uniref:ATP-binding protein n=1 Tax=Patulibacter minatonensis TaxID=298163 RepID=UPI00146FB37D|nr:ATP-binding protein [Patulibacter minatonensis]
MRQRLTPLIVSVSVSVACLIGIILAGLTLAVVELRDAGRDAARAEQTIAVATRVERNLIDLETGERGFLVTGEEIFLQPYDAARKALPKLLTWLETGSDESRQDARGLAIANGIRSYESGWARPVVALGRRDLGAARRKVATGRGKEIVDRLRRQFDTYVAEEQARADRVRGDAEDAGTRGVVFGVAGGVVSVLLVLAFGGYLLRLVVLPVRRLAEAVGRVAGGDLQAEVVESGGGEVGRLARSFNDMSRALQEHHDELEGQTAEVEAQRDDLERTFSELEDEKAWVETLFGFVERLVAESDLDGVARVAVEQAVKQGRADAGVLRLVDDEGELELAAAVGVPEGLLPRTVSASAGVTGRAVVARRPVALAHADAGLEVEGFGGPSRPVRVRHELHVPLLRGDELLGVVVIARVADRRFQSEEIDRVRGLAEQAAVALAKAAEERRSARLSAVNTAVLDATSFGIVMYDTEGRVSVINRRMREMAVILGITYDSTVEERVATMLRFAVDREATAADFAKVVEDPRHHMRTELHVRETGHWFVARTDPVADAAGNLLGRIVSFRDSTRDHEIQQMRDEFVATVTHELRTPLSSVVAAVDLLDDETAEPTPGQLHWTGMIRRNVDRLLRLVDDLLTVARADSGEFTLHPAPVDLEVVATDAVASARAAADAKGVTIEAETAPSPVRADVTRIAQAVDNLLANAVKFTPAGGTVRLRVVPQSDVDTVLLEVADSGIGIPEADRVRLFERFYRAPAATKGAIPGTGLGLTITKAIVEAHGGTIRVADGIDGGTAFVLVLPAGGPDPA